LLVDFPVLEEHCSWPSLDEIEAWYVAEVIEHTGGNKSQAARILGVDRKTVERMIARHRAEK
jgi:DNA-binding protein Fis